MSDAQEMNNHLFAIWLTLMWIGWSLCKISYRGDGRE
jgi:hypothetical protein